MRNYIGRYASLIVCALACCTAGHAQVPFGPDVVICIVPGGNIDIVSVEGTTELAGDVVLVCAGGTPTPSGQPIPQYSVSVTMNTNLTSRLMSGNISEALLMIDEPEPPTGAAVPNFTGLDPNAPRQIACTPLGAACSETGTGGSPSPYLTQPNIFAGALTGANQVTWQNIPIDAPGPNGMRIIR